MGDSLNIDNNNFDGLISKIYLSDLQLNKANSTETEAPFWGLHLSILDGFISCKIYDKRDDFDFEIVIFFLLGWGCSSSSILRCLYTATNSVRQSSHVTDFNTRNRLLIAELPNQGYRYH